MKDVGSRAYPGALVALILLLPFLTGGDVGPRGRGDENGTPPIESSPGDRSIGVGPEASSFERDEVVLGAGDQARIMEGGRTVVTQQRALSADEVKRLEELRRR